MEPNYASNPIIQANYGSNAVCILDRFDRMQNQTPGNVASRRPLTETSTYNSGESFESIVPLIPMLQEQWRGHADSLCPSIEASTALYFKPIWYTLVDSQFTFCEMAKGIWHATHCVYCVLNVLIGSALHTQEISHSGPISDQEYNRAMELYAFVRTYAFTSDVEWWEPLSLSILRGIHALGISDRTTRTDIFRRARGKHKYTL